MSATNAAIGYGTLFAVRTSTGPDVYTTVAEVNNVTPPGISRDAVDATHEESPNGYREFIAGMKDGGEVSIELNYTLANATALLTALEAGLGAFKVTMPGGETWSFSAVPTNVQPEAPIDDKIALSATFKISGKPVLAAAVAPVNAVLPAISGLLTTGATLTAYPGVWSGSPTFTYVWKNAGVAIVGATSSTYVLVGGDSGDAIAVTVTATNAAGNASATSAPVIGA